MENAVREQEKAQTQIADLAEELRCPKCHKLLMKSGEIKCPRCKDLVAVAAGQISLPQESLYIINTATLIGRKLKELISKWPAALQQEFAYALQLMAAPGNGDHESQEIIREALTVKLVQEKKQPKNRNRVVA